MTYFIINLLNLFPDLAGRGSRLMGGIQERKEVILSRMRGDVQRGVSCGKIKLGGTLSTL
jgi:hypothetical protein